MFADGFDVFVEIGPKAVLTGLVRANTPAGSRPLFVPILAPNADCETAMDALLKLYVRGAKIDWPQFYNQHSRPRMPLPTYPFQRKRYWFKKGPTNIMREQKAVASQSKKERRDGIIEDLRTRIARTDQADVSDVNVQLPFLEMGADSLIMVEAIRVIETEYGVKLAIRRFFEDLSTIEAVAEFIESNLEDEAVSSVANVEQAPASSLPEYSEDSVAVQPAAGSSAIEQVLIEQNRTITKLLSQQMDLLRESLSQRTPQVAGAPDSALAVKVASPNATRPGGGSNGSKAPEQKNVPMVPWGTPAEQRARGLSPAQQKHLEDLIQRYNARTRKSKEYVQRYRGPLADSRATVGFRFSTKEMLYPIVGQRSSGSRLWDIDGNEYIDFTMGFGVHLFGHTPSSSTRRWQESSRQGSNWVPDQTSWARLPKHLPA